MHSQKQTMDVKMETKIISALRHRIRSKLSFYRSIIFRWRDAGKTWQRIISSPKVPITCLGQNLDEMTTSAGDMHVTDNDGRNRRAHAKEIIDPTLNIISFLVLRKHGLSVALT